MTPITYRIPKQAEVIQRESRIHAVYREAVRVRFVHVLANKVTVMEASTIETEHEVLLYTVNRAVDVSTR